jgi:hypothetical protein
MVTPRQPVALVQTYCNVMSGTFAMLYSFVPGSSPSHPRLRQWVLPVTDQEWTAVGFHASGPDISMPASGYTGNEPICCPGLFDVLHWRWRDGHYVMGSNVPITRAVAARDAQEQFRYDPYRGPQPAPRHD